MYSTSSSSESSDTNSFATIELESRDEVNPVAKEESRGDEEVFEVFETIRAESASAEVMDPPPGSSSAVPPPGSSNLFQLDFFTKADFGDDGSVAVADNGSGDGTKSVIIIISRWKIARTNSCLALVAFSPLLPRRPSHVAAANDVDVEVKNALRGGDAVIDDDAVAAAIAALVAVVLCREALGVGHLGGHHEEVA